MGSTLRNRPIDGSYSRAPTEVNPVVLSSTLFKKFRLSGHCSGTDPRGSPKGFAYLLVAAIVTESTATTLVWRGSVTSQARADTAVPFAARVAIGLPANEY